MRFSDELTVYDLSESVFPRTWEVLKAGILEEVAPGFVVGLWSRKLPSRAYIGSTGQRRVFPAPLPLFPDTIFDIASVSKVFATATLAATLVDRGWLTWETRAASILPNFAFDEIQLLHLLSHTAGYSPWMPYWERMKDYFAPRPLHSLSIELRQKEMRDLVFSTPPEMKPGIKAVYSDISFLVLGFLLEELTRMPLDKAVREFVWKPMGIQRAYYRRIYSLAGERLQEKVAATENSSWRGGVLQGQVHDDNCWAMGGYGGHAGVFCDARELLHFARALFEGFLSPKVLKMFWTRVTQPVGCERTLGWDTVSLEGSSAGHHFSNQSVGHLGFTGTSLWIDPKAGLAVTLLSNRVHPSRENQKIKLFRPQFHDAIRLDWEENSPGIL